MPDTWEALEHDCKNCRECSLWETRTNVVFGVGNQNAEVLFIGEGPGANEDAQGVPFVGRAGHLLDDMLEMIYLDRTKVYIANIVKCRPPHNRDPQFAEQKCCSKKKDTRRGVFLFGAGYGNRTRLLGLGSRCTTDVLTLRTATC